MQIKPKLAWLLTLTLLLNLVPLTRVSAQASTVFINEIHYDNTGGDADEAIEIAGEAGLDVVGWRIVLYNGSSGATYYTEDLTGVIPDQQNGFGTISYPIAGIQNGSPDGIALVDPVDNVVQFLSYEGVITAVGGPADGMTSTDIGVSEPGDTPLGYSLQLSGTGSVYEDFGWSAAAPNTFGAVNAGQTFGDGGDDPPTVSSTSPADGETNVALDADITLSFGEDVTVSGTWFDVTCTLSGAHTATVSGGPQDFTLNPDADFVLDDVCTVTIYASQVADQDGTPDNMLSDYGWSFAVLKSGGPVITPIYDIQYTLDASGDSLLVGQTVTTTGIVYAVYGYGYCIADASGPWHGLYAYTGSSSDKPQVGDEVQVAGTVTEYYGLTEISPSTFTLLSNGNTPHAPSVVTAADIVFDDSASELYESVFVETHDIEVTAGIDSHGIWSFTDASSVSGKADDFGYHLEPNVGDTFNVLRGALIYDWDEYKVMPRNADDVTTLPQIVVTEIMQNPNAVGDSAGEWFEVYNAGNSAVDLDGWIFRDDGSNAFTVAGPLVIQPDEYLVLGINADTATNGGVALDYNYPGGFSLGNGDDEIIIEDAAANEINRVAYDGGIVWPDPTGASMMLVDLALDNNDGTNWSTTPDTLPYGDGDYGTPGCPNGGCVWQDVTIPAIQGVGVTSPYSDTIVRTTGVVVGVFEGNLPSGGGNYDGFYVQDADGDGDPATSDGIFVNHGTLDVSVSLGDLVTVIGTVQEFNEYGDLPPQTETQVRVSNNGDVTVVGSGTIVPASLAPDGTTLYFEAREGMLVNMPPEAYPAPVVGPTSYGTFFLVRGDEGVDHVMRGSPQEGKTFGVRNYWRYGNGGPNLIVGSSINTGVEGPLAYSYGNFLVALQNLGALDYVAIEPPAPPPAWPTAAADQLTVGSFNTYNFDSTGTQLTKVAGTIDAMGGPLFLGLQEIAVDTVIADLLTALNGMGYDYAYAYSHPDVGNHGVALLWRTDRVTDVEWSTEYQGCSEFGSGSSTGYDDYCEGTGLLPLFSRRPVVATATITLNGYPHQVTLIANHFKSKLGGAESDQRRLEQGQFVAGLVDGFLSVDPDANIVVLGDLNDFENSPPVQALTDSGNLTNAWYTLSPEARYSYIYNGTSQVLDHILVSSNLLDGLDAFGPLHTDADYPYNPWSEDSTVIWRTSDHDPLASTFYLAPPVLPLEQMRLVTARFQWHPSADGRANFYLTGQLQLPAGYTRDDLTGELTLSLDIAGESVAETLSFTPRGDNTWLYQASGQVQDGIKVRYARIHWADTIFITIWGKLDLSSVNQHTQPAEATIGLSFPVDAFDSASVLVGETLISCWTFGNRWLYFGW